MFAGTLLQRTILSVARCLRISIDFNRYALGVQHWVQDSQTRRSGAALSDTKSTTCGFCTDISGPGGQLSLPKTSSGNHQKLLVLHARHLSEQFEGQASCHKKLKFA